MGLYQQDRSVLGGDLLTVQEVTLEPGQSRPVNKPLGAEATALGVVAAFRDVERARWRASVNLTPGKDNPVVVWLEDVAVGASLVGA